MNSFLLYLALTACMPTKDGATTDDDTNPADTNDTRGDSGTDTTPTVVEGQNVGDCTDGADNDGDGAFDCLDDSCSGSPDCDVDGDGIPAPTDCDDQNEDVSPDHREVYYNGVDDDCNPRTLDDDADGDGVRRNRDCDDRNAEVSPDGEEIPYDTIDNDCDPSSSDDDADGDGHLRLSAGGDDCDDHSEAIYAGAPEADDGIDSDCNHLDGSWRECIFTGFDQAATVTMDLISDTYSFAATTAGPEWWYMYESESIQNVHLTSSAHTITLDDTDPSYIEVGIVSQYMLNSDSDPINYSLQISALSDTPILCTIHSTRPFNFSASYTVRFDRGLDWEYHTPGVPETSHAHGTYLTTVLPSISDFSIGASDPELCHTFFSGPSPLLTPMSVVDIATGHTVLDMLRQRIETEIFSNVTDFDDVLNENVINSCRLPTWASAPNCDDGIDNDEDGWADDVDPDCHWRTGHNGYEHGFFVDGPVSCYDGWDNDGDGLIDADDPMCTIVDEYGFGLGETDF